MAGKLVTTCRISEHARGGQVLLVAEVGSALAELAEEADRCREPSAGILIY
jgi:hypothetical protein